MHEECVSRNCNHRGLLESLRARVFGLWRGYLGCGSLFALLIWRNRSLFSQWIAPTWNRNEKKIVTSHSSKYSYLFHWRNSGLNCYYFPFPRRHSFDRSFHKTLDRVNRDLDQQKLKIYHWAIRLIFNLAIYVHCNDSGICLKASYR